MKLENFRFKMETNKSRSYYGLYKIHNRDFTEYISKMYNINDTWEKENLDASLGYVYYDPIKEECVVSIKGYQRCNIENLEKLSHHTGVPTKEQMKMANEAIRQIKLQA